MIELRSCRGVSSLCNIVGYGPTSYTDGEGQTIGGLCSGACFKNMSGGTLDLNSIKVTGYIKVDGQGGTMAGVQMQVLDAGGGSSRTYGWIDYTEGEETMGPGWFETQNGTYEPLADNDIVLVDGEGLWAIIQEDGLSLQTSGAVETTTDVGVDMPISRGGIVLANPTPVAVDINNCYVTGYSKDPVTGEGGTMAGIQVQTLDYGGGSARTYGWIDYTEGGESMGPGWFETQNGTYEPLADDDIVCEPGAGTWSIIQEDGLTFWWPKVILAK